MLKRFSNLATLAAVTLALAWSAPALGDMGPQKALKMTHDSINRLLARKVAKGSAEDRALQDKVRVLVNSFLDYRELARLSLKKHWDQRTAQEQQEFVSLLQDLIERSYVKQLTSNHGYKLEYRKEISDGARGAVLTAVTVENNGRKSEILIEYKMQKVGKVWMVYDVITDEVSIVANYRSQFNRIIKKDSYEHLVKKMRNKLEKVRKENS